jgi:PadR family transcriptional regulator PadR
MIFKIDTTLLEAIVLSIISGNDTYGYKITQEIRDTVELSESTLYPVLRRLKNYGFLESYAMEFHGKMRCYYKITENGKTQLALYEEEWVIFTNKIDRVFNESAMLCQRG